MRIAAIADVHANLAALEAVLQRIDRIGVDAILCLGDTIGYQAEPAQAFDLVMQRATYVVAGNHDVDISAGREIAGTNGTARLVQEWTRDQLDAARLDALCALPHSIDIADAFTARHGSFLGNDPTTGYVTSTMVEENLAAIAAGPRNVAFCGHTHVPMIAWLAEEKCGEPRVREGEIEWPERAEAVLINPGAVGQPRDRDPRAAFAIVDFERRTAAWHRVPYEIARTASAIHRAGLPAALVERLMEGR
ncbi:MAG TPA: metallophosphoesterase family protein [Thermoanaerobaculia bacterium]